MESAKGKMGERRSRRMILKPSEPIAESSALNLGYLDIHLTRLARLAWRSIGRSGLT